MWRHADGMRSAVRFAMPASLSWPTMATTRGPCSTTSGTRTSSARSATPSFRPTIQGLLERLTLDLGHLGAAASGRRQARDDFRFPLETIYLNETLGAPSVRAMERLFAAIDAEEARAPRHSRSFDF